MIKSTAVIVGAGVGGSCTALELAKSSNICKVALIETKNKLMKGSSDASPGRMGLGFHYCDVETAIFYLHSTVRFTKSYGKFREQHDKPMDHPLRRGRYFVMKDSIVPLKEVLTTYEAIKVEYRIIIAEDPTNEVFGPPDNLYRVLHPDEYKDDVVVEDVVCGVETAEELLDCKRFRLFIISELKKFEECGKVDIYLGTEVIGLKREVVNDNTGSLYTVICLEKEHGTTLAVTGDVVINSAWQNIPAINHMLGLRARNRYNRLKAIVTIKLPESMLNKPSMFFCMGPFCMFSNKGNGIGMITCASITNVAICCSQTRLNPELDRMLNDKNGLDREAMGQRILKGVSKYIPGLAYAEVLKVGTGIIQTYQEKSGNKPRFFDDNDYKKGNLDFLHQRELSIFKRSYSGIEVLAPGYIVNACMKLMYCFDNAEEVTKIISDYTPL